MEILLPRSKTDQLREGEKVFIAKTNSEYCPVKNTLSFLEAASLDIKTDGEAFLIPSLNKKKNGHVASKSRGISYTRAYEIFKEHIKAKNLDPSLYGLHSFRSGGASKAANNGISDRLISKHGRWSTETARDGYIKDSNENRLCISKNLGL